ncbi:MAG: dapF [Gammaproteobacteria bacterium]|jgi:diaminopimelate epimerase|nr:dapF [Gammaproteobacteria bacterium]
MLKFCKMQDLGNDFMIIEAIHQTIDIKNIPISLLSDRHRGIGFDQLLFITSSSHADFACRIFNADGSEAEQCGNGMRCVARFVQEEQFTKKKSLTLETLSGIVNVIIHSYNHIEVNMGIPCFEPEKIPFITKKIAAHYELSIHPEVPPLQFTVLSMGNPHAILHVPAVKEASVAEIGSKISLHPAFPKGTNVGFMEIINSQKIRLRTYERGVGETFACGSNACAAVVAGILNHGLERQVSIELAYGSLLVEWRGKNSPLLLGGAATRIFSGIY